MNTIHLDCFSGEDRTFTLIAKDENNAVVNLTSKTVTWRVGRSLPNDRNAILSKSGTVTGASTGTFTVTLLDTDTTDMQGDYLHQAITTDGSGLIAVVVVGRLRIRADIEA